MERLKTHAVARSLQNVDSEIKVKGEDGTFVSLLSLLKDCVSEIIESKYRTDKSVFIRWLSEVVVMCKHKVELARFLKDLRGDKELYGKVKEVISVSIYEKTCRGIPESQRFVNGEESRVAEFEEKEGSKEEESTTEIRKCAEERNARIKDHINKTVVYSPMQRGHYNICDFELLIESVLILNHCRNDDNDDDEKSFDCCLLFHLLYLFTLNLNPRNIPMKLMEVHHCVHHLKDAMQNEQRLLCNGNQWRLNKAAKLSFLLHQHVATYFYHVVHSQVIPMSLWFSVLCVHPYRQLIFDRIVFLSICYQIPFHTSTAFYSAPLLPSTRASALLAKLCFLCKRFYQPNSMSCLERFIKDTVATSFIK
ncbi:hypothetical protein RFI_22739, partial [Reticulomyxa filosa]